MSTDDDHSIIGRRKWISRILTTDGRISEKKIQDQFNPSDDPAKALSIRAIRSDMEFIKDYEDRQIFERKNAETKQLEWIDNSSKLGATRKVRLTENFEAKFQISQMLSALLVGFEDFTFTRDSDKQRIAELPQITTLIRNAGGLPLLEKLTEFWNRRKRSLFLDSGTTTHIFAESFVQHFALPMSGYLFREAFQKGIDTSREEMDFVEKIEVITNDRHIFNCLGKFEVNTKTIIVGGRQQSRSATISGGMAERFLKVNDLNADLSIIAANSVCLLGSESGSYISAENEHEASIKLQFLERSGIRIIVADSTKFQKTKGHFDNRICPISRKDIDMILTDYVPEKFSAQVANLGIPVIQYRTLSHI